MQRSCEHGRHALQRAAPRLSLSSRFVGLVVLAVPEDARAAVEYGGRAFE